MAVSETDVDSLGLVTISYGNQGLNPDLVVDNECLANNGTIDCTGQTVQVSSMHSVPRNAATFFDIGGKRCAHA